MGVDARKKPVEMLIGILVCPGVYSLVGQGKVS
jgi:hypothetical protein